MSQLHISLSAEKLFYINNSLPVTNSILTTWLVMGFIFIISLVVTSRIKMIPTRLQSIVEIFIEGIYKIFEAVLHGNVKNFFPLLGTLFIFILSSNWAGLLPGVGTIGMHVVEEGKDKFIPLFRSASADINTTLALALIIMFLIQITGFKNLGLNYLSKFFNFRNPIYFYVGILELIGEFAKIISFAFRLFGNIFAGEVLLTVIAFLIPIIAPLPFLGLELFVGFIQALVFSMLAAVFLSQAMSKAEH